MEILILGKRVGMKEQLIQEARDLAVIPMNLETNSILREAVQGQVWMLAPNMNSLQFIKDW